MSNIVHKVIFMIVAHVIKFSSSWLTTLLQGWSIQNDEQYGTQSKSNQ